MTDKKLRKSAITDGQITMSDAKQRKSMETFSDTLLTALRREHPRILKHLEKKEQTDGGPV